MIICNARYFGLKKKKKKDTHDFVAHRIPAATSTPHSLWLCFTCAEFECTGKIKMPVHLHGGAEASSSGRPHLSLHPYFRCCFGLCTSSVGSKTGEDGRHVQHIHGQDICSHSIKIVFYVCNFFLNWFFKWIRTVNKTKPFFNIVCDKTLKIR